MDQVFKHQLKLIDHGVEISKYATSALINDPSRLLFKFARYKHCSRLLEGLENVLEIGSADCLGSAIVAEKVGHLYCLEEHSDLFTCAVQFASVVAKNISVIKGSFPNDINKIRKLDVSGDLRLDAIFALDVLEHITPESTDEFLMQCTNHLDKSGVFICGIPSLESQKYASAGSKEGHVNCMTKSVYKKLLGGYFSNTFIFGINDETLHTGYGPMCHYLLALCTGPIEANNIPA